MEFLTFQLKLIMKKLIRILSWELNKLKHNSYLPIIIVMKNKENQQLQKQYLNNSSLNKQMMKNSDKFKMFEQQVLYLELNESSKSMVIKIKSDSQEASSIFCSSTQKSNMIIVFGHKQPTGSNSIEKLILNIINIFPRPSNTYSVIYFNTLSSKNAYGDFKKILQFLPIQYYVNLDQLYILQASFMSKATKWVSFNYLQNYMKSKTVHVATMKDLIGKANLNIQPLLKLLPVQLINELAIREQFVKSFTNKNILKSSLISLSTIAKQQNSISKSDKSVFHSGMFTAAKPKKNILQDYELGQTGAPLVIELLLYYFNDKQDQLKVEGVFRKSANIEEQTEILKELECRNYDFLQNINDPHLIANAVKRLLSNLQVPIIPFNKFEVLMELSEEKLTDTTISSIKTLDNIRKMTLLILLEFFIEKILPYTLQNKMTENNLCIVIGPCLMRSEVASIKDFFYSQKVIKVMGIILKQFEIIFGNKRERAQLIRKSARIQYRETIKRMQQKQYGQVKLQKNSSNNRGQQLQFQNLVGSKESINLLQTNLNEDEEQQLFEQNRLTKEQQVDLNDVDDLLSHFSKKK